jgi:D-arabinonate dehydratase
VNDPIGQAGDTRTEVRPGDPDPIRSVDVFDCVVPLPEPLAVGSATVSSRSYAIVRIRTEGGAEGFGYAFGRGLPVARIISQALAPVLVGCDVRSPERVRERVAGAYWSYAEQGLVAVALSAVDLAVWDLLGKRAGLPLVDLLGRRDDAVDACFVGGYAKAGASWGPAALEAEIGGFVGMGARAVKLTIGGGSPREDAERLRVVRRVLGDEPLLVVDAFRTFRSLDDARARVRLLEPFDLAYLEDPFAESLAPLIVELKRHTSVPIGLGENLSGHRTFRALIASGAVDVVRCDVSVVGGVREFMAVAALCSAHGLPLSSHVHPDVHVHLAAAIAHRHPAGLEVMLPSSGLDGFHRLTGTPLVLEGGQVRVPDRPGLGLDIDWDAVDHFARA